MHLFFPAFHVRQNPFAFNHLPGVWCAMLPGNQSKAVKGPVHQSGPKLQLLPTPVKATLWRNHSVDSETFTLLFWHMVLVSSLPILGPTITQTLGMGVNWGRSRNPTELPVFSCILLPLWEIIWQPGTGSMQSIRQVWLPEEGTLLGLCTTHLRPLPQSRNHELRCMAIIRAQGSSR